VITLTCPSSAIDGCRGTVTLRLLQSPKQRMRAIVSKCARGCRSLGSGTYAARAGSKVKVRAHVASFGRQMISKRKSLRATITVTNVSGGRTATTVLVITLKSHRHHNKAAQHHG
jgi:hypothetical protein